MAANLATGTNQQPAFASLRENPWHKMGRVFQEEVSGQEMLKLAGIDYEVYSREIFTTIETDAVLIPDQKAIVRKDTKTVLGVVGKDYETFQNKEVIDFFEGLVQERKIVYETSGALGNGETIFVLARIPDLQMSIKGDEILTYMLIRTGHIGNFNLACFPTTIRTVCSNTFSACNKEFTARQGKYGKKNVHAGYTIRHTRNMRNAVIQVQQAYAGLMKDFEHTKALFELLADKEVTQAEVRTYFLKCLETKSEEKQAATLSKLAQARQDTKMDALMKLWNAPTNQTGTKNTAFALLNTVTEFVDHERGTRCTDETMTDGACRFESAMFGSGAKMKEEAMVNALALV